MLHIFSNTFYFVIVLGVLIFVHELGHFLMARRIGVRVITFSLGFGPKLFRVQRGGTEYCVSAVPLGGYVKMAGENPDDPRSGRDDEFLSKSKWQRFQVLIMGPLANILLAIIVLAIVFMWGVTVPAYEDKAPVVGALTEHAPAEKAGIQPGDRIVSVAGRQVETWNDLYMAVGTKPNQTVPLVVTRGGRTFTVDVTPRPQGRYEIGDIGVLPDVHPSITSVNPGEPAGTAGLRPGDQVIAVDGKTITFIVQLQEAIAKSPERPLTMTVVRDGKPLDVTVTPLRREDKGVIGIGMAEASKTIQPGPLRAVWLSVERNYESSVLILQTLWGLFTRETSPKQLMGPVAIGQLSGDYGRAGLLPLLMLIASISLNLGLLNLLPIPVLDGGHITIMALEGVARRDFSMKVKEKMLLAGFVLLMVLMVTVIYNDLTRVQWIERLMFWR